MPGAVAVLEIEPVRRRETVVGGEIEMLGVELEAGHEHAARREMLSQSGNDLTLGARRKEDHHISRQDHRIEAAPHAAVIDQVEAGEIGDVPFDVWTLSTSSGEHVFVQVDADHLMTPPVELDGDPARTTSCIENPSDAEGGDEVRLAVRILTLFGKPIPPSVIVVAPRRRPR